MRWRWSSPKLKVPDARFLARSNLSASAAARFAVFSVGARMPGFSIRFAAYSSWYAIARHARTDRKIIATKPPRDYAFASKNETDGVRVMNQTNDALWLSFEALAKTYPHDDGVRMTADLARWLLEERQRLKLPTPPIIEKVVRTATQEADVPAARLLHESPVAGE
jgi:hypothetical protein